MLVTLAITALASFAGAVILAWFQPLPPAAHLHLALAAGVMPLILGAMSHFVPVLTRSGAPAAAIHAIPLLALAAGVLAVFSFIAPNQIYYFAALLALAAATMFAGWIASRGRSALGKPHPCLHWYLAAIACLILALAAVAAMALWPEQRLALKRLHLHLNTLGFIGLTAIATLQVLLPTAVGRPDPQTANRLRQDLKWALGGTLLISAGAAWLTPLAWVGTLLWALPVLRLGQAWLKLYRAEIRHIHGAAPSFATALAGFVAALLFGVLHTTGALLPSDSAHAFILAFLFPLVTGAISQLLPVWLKPGPQNVWHEQMRQRLQWGGGIRGLLFLGGGLLLAGGWRGGMILAVAALVLFLLQLIGAARIRLKRYD
ncbi:hypothetical protein SCD_n00464 [Sulfuricella denitrificans skB26]|uniref:Uncharacterized protein n=1 Tax=Sulfuricella denitrificans (strain DSM 22764 / NBRC 105220 / skB26) TaxID=1163617 RepID=S6AB48_SULDS|nr:hypothetical protein [Sulfuricella denitrificans]BAN34313.1 hypothetical protein SCD_n00464 [Sulfuricella denitrificans skB26]